MNRTPACVVMTTVPNKDQAEQLARVVLEVRLARLHPGNHQLLLVGGEDKPRARAAAIFQDDPK
jgi:hypothetical protein